MVVCDQLTDDADFGKKKIISPTEAHFGLGGYVNKQNCRIWGTETGTHTLKSRSTQNESLFGARSTLIHCRPQQLNMVQELKPIDHLMRFRFAKWACDRLTKDTEFGKKITLSEEAHFDFGRL